MDAKDYIVLQIKSAHALVNSVLDGTAQDLVNRTAYDGANTIAAVLAHVAGAEDYFVQAAILGKPRLWESEWRARLGIASEIGRDWSIEIPDLAAFRAYLAAVMAATDAYAGTLTSDELGREVMVFGNPRPVGRTLATLCTHAASHAGEIATLKGCMGVKGLPF